jgi:hypothetical protein
MSGGRLTAPVTIRVRLLIRRDAMRSTLVTASVDKTSQDVTVSGTLVRKGGVPTFSSEPH